MEQGIDAVKTAVLYVHGKGGSAGESEHYKTLFPGAAVFGLDYKTFTPWETGEEIRLAVEKLAGEYDIVIPVANSIGAFFCMNAHICGMVRRAYFISPIVDMEKLILGMMRMEGVTEEELEAAGVIRTSYGEELSWNYLSYVRDNPPDWDVPTQILYGSEDALTTLEAVNDFARAHKCVLTVMEGGEHWFHTEEQMRFLDGWIRKNEEERGRNMKMIAYCGLNCEACEARIATVNDDNNLRQKVAKLWSELNNVEITPEMINCDGCRVDGRKTVYCESLCPIRQCALTKNYETCGDCAELKGCKKAGMVIGNNEEARKNLGL
ncbi:MAG: DUF3795 domain-containing protein [Clostridia bacterium]|nr:DUF3795 domain-containing protein [Clostridia bacterium]